MYKNLSCYEVIIFVFKVVWNFTVYCNQSFNNNFRYSSIYDAVFYGIIIQRYTVILYFTFLNYQLCLLELVSALSHAWETHFLKGFANNLNDYLQRVNSFVPKRNNTCSLLGVDSNAIIGNDGRRRWRDFEFLSCEFEDGRERSVFWHIQYFVRQLRIGCQSYLESDFGSENICCFLST